MDGGKVEHPGDEEEVKRAGCRYCKMPKRLACPVPKRKGRTKKRRGERDPSAILIFSSVFLIDPLSIPVRSCCVGSLSCEMIHSCVVFVLFLLQ